MSQKGADTIWTSPAMNEVIHEQWLSIDRWWTETPVRRTYRRVTRDGRTFTELLVNTVWEEVEEK